MHDQANDIEKNLQFLEHELTMLGYPDHCVHTGPIIRQEDDYKNIDINTRRRIFNKMVAFFKQLNIRYKTFYIEKRKTNELIEATEKLSKQISQFIKDNYSEFLSYSSIKIYYDNGQVEVNKILKTVFNELLQNVEFKKVLPSKYRLFQVADLICTFELLRLKYENHTLSKSEIIFFGSERFLNKNYLKHIIIKSWKS